MRVSSLSSNDRHSGVRCTTVRHTPFTATDEPMSLSLATREHPTERFRSRNDRTTPSSSTMPVNIGLHPYVASDVPNVGDVELGGAAERRESRSPDHAGRAGAPQELRGEIEHETVDHVFLDGAPREGRSALDQELLDVAFPERFHDRPHGDGAARSFGKGKDLGARVPPRVEG